MLNFTKTVVWCLAVLALTRASEAGEAIAYRLSNTKEMHFDDARKAEQHLAAVKKLGCEARMDSNGGHTDVSIRCPKWKHIEVASHQAAAGWQDWLRKNGFETRHEHAEQNR